MTRLLPILAILFSGCVAPQNAGPYPHGFIAFGRMHYWSPAIHAVKEPVYGDYVVVDYDGNLIVSPESSKNLR